MRITKGVVSKGRVIVEGEPLAEGAEVTILSADELGFELSANDEAALLLAIGEADRGETVDVDDFLPQFRP